jgi:hypothetical protein
MSSANPEPSKISRSDQSPVAPENSEGRVNLPIDLEEAINKLPPEASGLVRAVFMSREVSTISGSSSLSKQINAAHIEKLIENDDKEDERRHQRVQGRQATNRWGMGALILLIVVVLTYAGITKKEGLAEKIIIAGISGIGGLGAGYAIGKNKE